MAIYMRTKRPSSRVMRQGYMVNLRVVRLLAFAILMALGALEPLDGKPRSAAPVTWRIFVDDLHIAFRDTGYVRKLLASIGGELIRAGTLL